MSSEKTLLAVDLGTSGMKVALITVSGRVLAWEVEPINLILTPDGGVEQNPEEWWQSFLRASRRLLNHDPSAPADVIAVCCSTQGEGTIPVDQKGNALGNCILWMDMRGASHLHQQLRGLININDTDVLKLMKFVHLTGGLPSSTGKDPAAHMLFIRNTQPEVYERTFKFLNVLDYMNLKLTGEFSASYDSIVTSWVTDNRHPDAIEYHDGLIQMLGIDREKLPALVPCTQVIGTLRHEVAEFLGLSSETRVVAGAIDTTAAAIGAGAVEFYAPHLYIGTSSWIAAHVPFKKTDVISSLASIPCAIPGCYLLIALQATAGGNLTFLRDNIIYHKDELLQETNLPDIFKVLDQIAERVPAGANGVLYTPWIWGERAPVEDRSLRAGLYNLSLHNTREDILRAFLEGVALNTRWLIAPVEKFMGRPISSINIIGGGAQSDIWCQIFADVLNVEIRQLLNPLYANACGAAWIGAVGVKEIEFRDIPQLVKFKNIYSPRLQNRAVYDEKFAVFQQIYHQMKDTYHRLNPLEK
ncbi:MAG: FGGY-family carbohydrate kinase [Anaerolineaceae bacterium]|nr:FGGY-family carbohydrate kinase [Anaerolineaceae bacterium]